MSHVFIGGIPASGKSYLARKVAEKTGAFHLNLDTLRAEMRNDPNLRYWTDFFFNQDEEKYLTQTSCEDHWKNLVAQSEAFWPTMLNKVKETIKFHKSVVVEGVNILPHLANKDFSFPGIFLLGESLEQIFERNKKNPRWGKTERLQRKEAELFFNCEREKYKQEAEKYGYKTFEDFNAAEKGLLELI
ncbi:AAA family ATPase [Candidatus Daviesbacteria bacterium]|nr:AAA family ATPase [Candidatus Daviesbacteria bacterium]